VAGVADGSPEMSRPRDPKSIGSLPVSETRPTEAESGGAGRRRGATSPAPAPGSGSRSHRNRRPFLLAALAVVLLCGVLLALVFTHHGPELRRAVPSGAVSVTAYGARGDGTTDDTGAVTRALSAATRAHKALFFPAGTYKVNALAVPSGADLVGAAAGRSWLSGRLQIAGASSLRDLKLGVNGAALHFANGATHTTFDRVAFAGGGAMSGDGCVVSFESGRTASFITFRDCTIGANPFDGNGVSINGLGWSGATYHDIVWQHCHFLGSPRMNLECTQRSDGRHAITAGYHTITVSDCVFEPSGSEAISFDATGKGGLSTISGCTIKGAGWNSAYPWQEGVEFNHAVGMRFVDNTIYRCRGAMINYSSDPGTTVDNVLSGNHFDATTTYISTVPPSTSAIIYFAGVNGAQFTNNLVKSDVGGQLLYLSASPNNRFANDRFIDTRTGYDAHQCAWLTSGSSGNVFSADFFQSPLPTGVIHVETGVVGTTVQHSTFVTFGAPILDTPPGVTVTLTVNSYR
jgi:hypothetical protein